MQQDQDGFISFEGFFFHFGGTYKIFGSLADPAGASQTSDVRFEKGVLVSGLFHRRVRITEELHLHDTDPFPAHVL